MTIVPGTHVGPYAVLELIGEGGMGVVYRATDTNLKRAVAIKVLPDTVVGDADRLARFQREAEVLARLNIAPTGSPRPQYDVSADGQRFLMLAPTTGTDASLARPRIVVVENWFDELKRLVPKN